MVENCGNKTEVLASEDGYRVTAITTREGLLEAYRLRYRVFCEGLGWAECREGKLEYDAYDESAVSFGVYDSSGALMAYVRLLTSVGRFMLEDTFTPLLGDEPIVRKEPDTAEVSRLCKEPSKTCSTKERNLNSDPTHLLIKGLHRWCREHGIRFLYAVMEGKTFRFYRDRMKLPLRQMGEPKTMPDGVTARVAVLDWREYENAVIARR